MCGNSSTQQLVIVMLQLRTIMSYAILVLIAIILASVVTAHDGICTRYGPNADVLGTSCIDIYCTTKILQAVVDLVTMLSKLIIFDYVYCDMELGYGGNKGGWMRIIDVDTSRGDTCPSGWTRQKSYCTARSAGCYSVHFPQLTVRYVVE